MYLHCLGSSSSGNCYLLNSDTECLVLEAGLPFRKVKEALGFDVLKIQGVVVSHQHL
jgi:metal-dependent hydrolase (beta-lactamase superfamily II)